ncbi:lytic murein transglycosylase [Aureimonas mangrovi]|uniref:lytic murein transglycosylase n=1 Tax=Aureimonas mangrovi TaxID=2758041 RepID=UPI00163D4726|nr:lytic murein transglycosylase [Aureimonas mangrovi]
MPGPKSVSLFLKTALVAAALTTAGAAPAAADAGFRQWIANFESTAAQNGVRRETYRAVFQGVTEPDHDVIERARFQPEFRDNVWDYLDNRVNDESVAEGRRMLREWGPWLQRIEQRFGVDRHILLAIWSMESNYGRALENTERLKNVPQALATLAYLDQRRARFARQQLIAALKIVQDGHVSPQGLTGSWAGAMGHTQFIPTSYQAWKVDMDGNGRADIWNSIPDALGTAANLLKDNGWRPGRTWGYEVQAPRGVNLASLDRANKTIGEWERLGFRRVAGRSFSDRNENANLVMLGGPNGPLFLMTRNFFVIKNYNNADTYALAVGHLADRIAGGGEFVQSWPRGYTPLSMQERYELQQRLTQRGLYDGKIDGKIGSGSRGAITAYQRSAGVEADGNASKALLELLRRH